MSGPLATWRTDSRLERDLTEESRRALRQRLATQAFAVVCVLAPFVVFVPTVEAAFLRPALVGSVIVACLGASSLALAAQTTKVRRRNALRLGEEYPIADGFLARVTVFAGQAPLGSDQGAVWMEDGRLYFAGPRTSYGLFASQVDPSGVEEGTASLRLPLRVSFEDGSMWLEIAALTKGKEVGEAQQQAQLAWMVRSWLATRSIGEGQWPPLTLGPDAPSANFLLFQTVTSTLYWTVAILATLGLILLAATWCTGIVLLPAVVWGVRAGMRVFPHPAEGWCAYRDRRRLELCLRQDNHQ